MDIITSVTLTLTLEGAKEDTITIKDSDNNTVATCVFASGQTSGTVSVTIPNAGGTYTFISSVAKDTISGTSNYSKSVSLTNTSSSVSVMPDNVMYWYGNTKSHTWSDPNALTSGGFSRYNVDFQTNKAHLYHPSSTLCYVGMVSDAVDTSSFSKIKVNYDWTTGVLYLCATLDNPTTSQDWRAYGRELGYVRLAYEGKENNELNISSVSQCRVHIEADTGGTARFGDSSIYAVWFE